MKCNVHICSRYVTHTESHTGSVVCNVVCSILRAGVVLTVMSVRECPRSLKRVWTYEVQSAINVGDYVVVKGCQGVCGVRTSMLGC